MSRHTFAWSVLAVCFFVLPTAAQPKNKHIDRSDPGVWKTVQGHLDKKVEDDEARAKQADTTWKNNGAAYLKSKKTWEDLKRPKVDPADRPTDKQLKDARDAYVAADTAVKKSFIERANANEAAKQSRETRRKQVAAMEAIKKAPKNSGASPEDRPDPLATRGGLTFGHMKTLQEVGRIFDEVQKLDTLLKNYKGDNPLENEAIKRQTERTKTVVDTPFSGGGGGRGVIQNRFGAKCSRCGYPLSVPNPNCGK